MASVGTDGLIKLDYQYFTRSGGCAFLKGGENIKSLEEVNTEAMLRDVGPVQSEYRRDYGKKSKWQWNWLETVVNSTGYSMISTMSDNRPLHSDKSGDRWKTKYCCIRCVAEQSEWSLKVKVLWLRCWQIPPWLRVPGTRLIIWFKIEADARNLIGKLSENLSQLQSWITK